MTPVKGSSDVPQKGYNLQAKNCRYKVFISAFLSDSQSHPARQVFSLSLLGRKIDKEIGAKMVGNLPRTPWLVRREGLGPRVLPDSVLDQVSLYQKSLSRTLSSGQKEGLDDLSHNTPAGHRLSLETQTPQDMCYDISWAWHTVGAQTNICWIDSGHLRLTPVTRQGRRS